MRPTSFLNFDSSKHVRSWVNKAAKLMKTQRSTIKMGKKRFNAKARQTNETIIDNSALQKIQIDLPDVKDYSGYDESNALVLPSKKRETKIKKVKQTVTRILSKKQRKKLEKIISKKKKKEDRSSLIEALASVQVPAEELQQYSSISSFQTTGLRKTRKPVKEKKTPIVENDDDEMAAECSGSSRKRKRLAYQQASDVSSDSDADEKRKTKDLNVVGLEADSGSDDQEDDDMDTGEFKSLTDAQLKELIANRNAEDTVPKVEITEADKKPSVYVHVDRKAEIQVARLKLPILAEEQVIMETIKENMIVIIAGSTGSGKTTQVPQFLYEAGYAVDKQIGITEPRRVAAISMSKRVAEEMNLTNKEVSYLIRFEGNVTEETKIKFMTDGVLLKEIESDFLLKKYSVIILDEAHERSVYTDILVGLLSRIVPLRNKQNDPMKLIIMSATLRVEDFTKNSQLFKAVPPVLQVDARQYPVTIHFQKRTPNDYVKEAYRKTVKIHSKLPEGGILIFVTGQKEVTYLVRKLRKTFPYNEKEKKKDAETPVVRQETSINEEEEVDVEFDMKRALKNVRKAKKKLASQTTQRKINLDDYKLPTEDTDADLFEMELDGNESDIVSGSEEELTDDDDEFDEAPTVKQPLWVLPLYSLLSSERQRQVFEPAPEGCRLCVVSTNVAETSLTIPNIKYVVDTGRQKSRLYDRVTGVSSFIVKYTSKASADQRAGRAGRIGPGHCYRLYSSAVYSNEFEDFAVPDIQKKPVDDLMLQMKCMGIDKVFNFPFPSPPNPEQLQVSEERLKLLGALEDVIIGVEGGLTTTVSKVTPLGYAISVFPVAPRYGKMLALSHQKDLLPYTVLMVAALSVQQVLLETTINNDENGTNIFNKKWLNQRLAWAGTQNSLKLGDPMVLIRAVGASEYAGSMGKLQEFCEENGLRTKAITEIRKLRVQLTNEINLNVENANICVDPKMEPPTDIQAKLLRQVLLAGSGNMVAKKLPHNECKETDERRKLKYAYNTTEMEEPVFIHSSSVLKKHLPEWVIYQEIYELQNGLSRKMFMRGVTAIEPEWLLIYAPKLCSIRSILDEPKPRYDASNGKVYCHVDATYGRAGWQLPVAEMEMPSNENACKYFGMFFLNGEVFPKLEKYKGSLKCTPSSTVKSWAKTNMAIANFNRALIRKQITTKQNLLDVWKENSQYLCQEYCDLLSNRLHSEVSLMWPPKEN